MTVDLVELNPSQRKAVEWDDGHVLVRAGPGSGKTRIIAHRIARIIQDPTGEYCGILGLSFTDKAAREMQKRVFAIVPDIDRRICITTFHSFSIALLHQHGHLLGIRSDFVILAEIERTDMVEEAIKEAKIQHQDERIKKYLLSIIRQLMQEAITVEDATAVLRKKGINDAEMIGAVYEHYRKLMIKNNTLDYDGILVETLRLLTTTPVGPLIRRIYKHVCVDEFQDTNTIQYEILCNVVDSTIGMLFVVADGNQAIYGWNGANPSILDLLSNGFNMKVLDLPENYRCPPSIISIANKLIARNYDYNVMAAVPPKQDDEDNTIRVKLFETSKAESEWVAKDITQRPAEEQRGCAILARRRGLLKTIVDKLNANGVPGHMLARKDEFVSNQMVWLHAMLRLANARQSRVYLSKTCISFCSLTGAVLNVDSIVSDAMNSEEDYLHAWLRAACMGQTDDKTRLFLTNTSSGLADKLDADGFIKNSFEWFESLPKERVLHDAADYQEEKDVFDKIIRRVTDETSQEHVTLNAILREVDQSSKEPPVPEDAIMCYTIHTSKGMEFDHVYLIGLVEDELPSWQEINKGANSAEMQEERRVCFVAITRAQKSLTMTCPLEVSGYPKKPSRFLKEMGLDV